MELDLAALGSALGYTLQGASLHHNPENKEADFFISFSHADFEVASRINQILRRRGYSTLFLAADHGEGRNPIAEIHEGLKRARRLILLFSPAYLGTAYGGREWQTFLPKDPDGRSKLVALMQTGECDVREMLYPLQVTGLDGREGAELERAVLRAAVGGPAAAEVAQPVARFEPRDDEREEQEETRRHSGSFGWIPATVILVFIAVLALVPTVPVVMTADLQLPLRWMLFDGNLRARSVVENDAAPLHYWMSSTGDNANLRWNRQWLDLRDTALLKATAAARDGIAQYTVGFQYGGVSLLSRAEGGGASAYETRLEYTRPGQMRLLVGRREARRYFAIEHDRTAPIYVGTQTMHDVAVSMKGSLHTVWLNGRSIATFQDSKLAEGAVGLKVAGNDKVRLYRWSINLDSDAMAAVRTIEPQYWASIGPSMVK